MTIKIRFHGDKAIMRWKNPGEAAFLKQQMTILRDSMSKKISISVKDDKGREVPKILFPPAPGKPSTASEEVIHVNKSSPEVSAQPVTVAVNQKPVEGGEGASQK